ncbi:MAG: hypothetical protein KGL39_21680 [Patescibacteria group bacterium]|nr:hypothetical protein [Patescibacteria group bacterium]
MSDQAEKQAKEPTAEEKAAQVAKDAQETRIKKHTEEVAEKNRIAANLNPSLK